MKINSKFLKKIQGRFEKPEVYDKRIMHPVREWLTGLMLFTCIAAAGGAYSMHTFVRFQDIHITEGATGELPVRYNQVLAKNALALYTQKRVTYETLQQQVVQNVPVFDIEAATTSTTTTATSSEVMAGTTTDQEIPTAPEGSGEVFEMAL